MARKAGGGVKARVSGVKALQKAFKEFEPKIAKTIARKSMRAGLSILRTAARSNAPVGATGAVRKAIRIKTAKRKKGMIRLILKVGAGDFKGKTFYAAFVEYGTKKQRAKNYMRQTFDAHAEAAQEAMEKTALALMVEAMKTR